VAPGTPVADAVRQAGLPLARACGSHGLCARCGVVVLAGAAALSGETPLEARAKRRNRVDPTQRLSCMAAVHGDVTITTSYW
jgi:ferredoxin